MDRPHNRNWAFDPPSVPAGRRGVWIALMVLALGMIACSPAREGDLTLTQASAVLSPTVVFPSPTVVPEATPAFTAIPAPTATASPTEAPEPVVRANLVWPARVSPLEPIPIKVTFDPPMVDTHLTVSATVLQPDGERYAVFELAPDPTSRGSAPAHYVAPESLQLPLIPAAGTWWLVAHVETQHPITGLRVRTFTAEMPTFRDLSGELPDGAMIQVPGAFEEVIATGGPQAGGRVWTYAGGELGLWWTPGPAEDLTLTTARMLVDASHVENARILSSPEIIAQEAVIWHEQAAYRFEERWEDTSSVGTVWVVQDDEDWLYVLRVRPVGDGRVPALVVAVAETLSFVK